MGTSLEQIGEWGRSSVTVKLFAVGILMLFLLIPTAMINTMVRERRERRDQAVTEISSSWAGGQTIRGPILSIPYRTSAPGPNGQPQLIRELAHFVPADLAIDGRADTEVRRRGIYSAAVYTSSLTIKGTFAQPSFEGLNAEQILWDEAFVSMGLGDLRGVKNELSLAWQNQKLPLVPGTENFNTTAPAARPPSHSSLTRYGNDSYVLPAEPAGLARESAGISARVKISPAAGAPLTFEVPITLRGSGSLWFIPVGKKTSVAVASEWADPAFKGAFLPDQRNVGPKGFDATWSVHYMNRNFPDRWTGAGPALGASAFGVDFLFPVDHYSNTLRSTKYAILFIFMTFLVFFFIEFFNKKRMHPIQYLLVGGGLVVFYLLLLSMSEHMRFGVAYTVATLAVVGLIGGYAHGVFERPKVTGTVVGTLLLLYGFLYTLLQMEDYALLIGSFGLFAALAAAMYLSRKINWYEA